LTATKRHLVARGFQQGQGYDYDEKFALVAHMTSFLNGDLQEEVYMQLPSRYSVPSGMVCHLRCSLYGLKHAPRAWFERFAFVALAFLPGVDPGYAKWGPRPPLIFFCIFTLFRLYFD
jgi:hypothetical protein